MVPWCGSRVMIPFRHDATSESRPISFRKACVKAVKWSEWRTNLSKNFHSHPTTRLALLRTILMVSSTLKWWHGFSQIIDILQEFMSLRENEVRKRKIKNMYIFEEKFQGEEEYFYLFIYIWVGDSFKSIIFFIQKY